MSRRPCTCTATRECPACQAWTARQQQVAQERQARRERLRLHYEAAPVRQTCLSHTQYMAGCRACAQACAAYQRHYRAMMGGRARGRRWVPSDV